MLILSESTGLVTDITNLVDALEADSEAASNPNAGSILCV